MESRVKYAAVGAFVLLLGAALIGLGLWLGSDLTVQRYDRYSIYFTESVSGLYLNAPVKYRGVVVGRVDRMEIADANPERVHVVTAIQQGTPVKTDTRAQLDPQGVTGVVHVELTGGTRQAPPLQRQDDDPYPVIASAPSLFSRLDEALTRGLQTMDDLAAQISQLLNERNLNNLERILSNLDDFSSALAANSDHLDDTLANLDRLTAHSADAAEEIPNTLVAAQRTLNRWAALASRLETVGDSLDAMANTGQHELEQVGRTTIPELNNVLLELQVLTDNLNRLSEELRDNPRMLLFGRPQAEPGPGE